MIDGDANAFRRDVQTLGEGGGDGHGDRVGGVQFAAAGRLGRDAPAQGAAIRRSGLLPLQGVGGRLYAEAGGPGFGRQDDDGEGDRLRHDDGQRRQSRHLNQHGE